MAKVTRQEVQEIIKPKERELELSTPDELVDQWIESIEGDVTRPLTTCIGKFDKDLRNKLRGTVGAYIGYGGTKKSLLALQACRQNVLIHENNCTGIYSNMEMAIFQFLSRVIDMSVSVDDWVYNSSHYFEREYESAFRIMNKVQMKKIRDYMADTLNKIYGSNLYINSQSSMTVDDFDKLIKRAKDKNGTVDILVIDGLSMMGGVGSETESYTANSKELKDLAKLHNIYIPLICHLSKGADKHTREVQRYIRGSEKILDNVDFVIQMSLLIDEFKSGDTTEYMSDKGYVRMYNKRGSGNTINVIYDFDYTTLMIKETDEEPANYDVKKDKKNF